MEHVVAISPTGAVRAMHHDDFSIGFLGTQAIRRASDIVWDEDTQSWGIQFIVGEVRETIQQIHCGFDSYSDARAFEVAVMNECLKRQTSPVSPYMLVWASRQRRK